MCTLDLKPNRYSQDLETTAGQDENSSAIQGRSPLPPEKKQRSTTHADSVHVSTGMYRAGLKRTCNTRQSLKVHTTILSRVTSRLTMESITALRFCEERKQLEYVDVSVMLNLKGALSSNRCAPRTIFSTIYINR